MSDLTQDDPEDLKGPDPEDAPTADVGMVMPPQLDTLPPEDNASRVQRISRENGEHRIIEPGEPGYEEARDYVEPPDANPGYRAPEYGEPAADVLADDYQE